LKVLDSGRVANRSPSLNSMSVESFRGTILMKRVPGRSTLKLVCASDFSLPAHFKKKSKSNALLTRFKTFHVCGQ
jgi:hypothetical protein